MSEEKQENGITPRRSCRAKKMSLKATEAAALLQTKLFITSPCTSSDTSSDEREAIVDTVLDENEKIAGKDIFNFKKQIKHEVVGWQTSDFERVSSNKSNVVYKTPKTVRKKLIKGIKSHLRYSSSDDYSVSDSEYSPSDENSDSYEEGSNKESEESKSDASGSENESSSDENKSALKKKALLSKGSMKPLNKPIESKRKKIQEKGYVINTEDYFSVNSLKSCKTSNHTLDKLKTPRLSQEQLHKLLNHKKISKAHEKSICEIIQDHKKYFPKWMYILHENFNILLYGLGSKRSILQDFQNDYLNSKSVVVINGFFPSLTLKEILDGIFDALELKETSVNHTEACEIISQEFIKLPEFHLYIIVHNIEGPMLCNARCQNILAKLASVKNIHLIATVDHINAPLIWDQHKLSKFNFTWWDVTSFIPYSFETSFENSILVQNTGNLGLSALRNVFMSLTSNSKGIYLKIVQYQLEKGNEQYYQGMLFKDLYWGCREAFLVSSDLALRAQLTEFVDHKMVKFRRSVDGGEYLVIPLSNTLLQQFLLEQEK